jgi:hypothetical protein
MMGFSVVGAHHQQVFCMFKRGKKQWVRALVLPLCINQPIFNMMSMVDTMYIVQR